jgi:putative methionine-R-sulfoxide reductase with GAF domain
MSSTIKKLGSLDKLKVLVEDSSKTINTYTSRNKNTLYEHKTTLKNSSESSTKNLISLPNKSSFNTTVKSTTINSKHIKAKSVIENPLITLNNKYLSTQDFKSSRLKIRSGPDLTPRKLSQSKLNVPKGEYNCESYCPNVPLIRRLEFNLNELILENEKLKTINNFFMISMGRKDDYLLTLLNHNSNLCKELNMFGKKESEHLQSVPLVVAPGDILKSSSSKNVIPKDSSKNLQGFLDSPMISPNINTHEKINHPSKFKTMEKFNLGESSLPVESHGIKKYKPEIELVPIPEIAASGGTNGIFSSPQRFSQITPQPTSNSNNISNLALSGLSGSGVRKSKFVQRLTFKKLEMNAREEKLIEESQQLNKTSNKKLPLSRILTNMVEKSLNVQEGNTRNLQKDKEKDSSPQKFTLQNKNLEKQGSIKSNKSNNDNQNLGASAHNNNNNNCGQLNLNQNAPHIGGNTGNFVPFSNQNYQGNKVNNSPRKTSQSPFMGSRNSIFSSPVHYSNNNNYLNNLPVNSAKRQTRAKSIHHYENILEMFNKKSRKDSIRDTRSSFLTVSNHVLSKIITQDVIREILRLTNNDDEFLNAMRTYPDDKLIMFSDSIGTLIKDYDYSINLIKRVKSFLQVSIRVVNTLILEDAVNMIIKNSCEILQCERTSIYVHDKLTNMLVIHAGEGLKKDQWRIPVNKGIVGHVFTTGERQKIDDAYLDERFNRDVDKKTGFRTRSMLCVPLKDEDGKCFGVIQGLNKRNGQLFSADDEELIDIFASQASLILKNSMRFDENLSFISRLKMLINFSIQVHSCSTLNEFSYMAGNLLSAFWSSSLSQILILDEVEQCLNLYKADNSHIKKPLNLGLIGRVYMKKETIAINAAFNNPYFNHIVDLECGFSLITFPIFDFKNESKVVAVGQVGYPFTISAITGRAKESDNMVIAFFSNIVSFWLSEFSCKSLSLHKKETKDE